MKTYIDYIFSFWRKRSNASLTSTESVLYLYLLHQCNLLRFKNPFRFPNDTIISALSIDKRTLRKSRTNLKDLQFIDYESGDGRGTNTLYTILDVPISEEERGTNQHPFSNEERDTKMHPFTEEKRGTKLHPLSAKRGTKKRYKNAPLTPIIDKDIYKDNILYEHNSVCVCDEDDVKNGADLIDVKDGILQAVIRQNHQGWIEIFCMNNHISPQAFGVSFDIWCKHILDQGTTKTTVADAKKHFANWYKLQVRIKTEKQNGTNNRQTISRAEQRRLDAEARNKERMQRIYAECGVSYPGDTSTQGEIPGSNSTNGGIPSETGEYPFD